MGQPERARDIVSVRDGILEKIAGHQSEIEMLEKNLAIVDEALKGSSFARASQLAREPAPEPAREPPPEPEHEPGPEPVRITADDGGAIASAYVTPESVSIVLEDGVGIGEDVPPFKSFFLEGTVGQMAKKDEAAGGAVISCSVSSGGSGIREIIIRDYGGRERADEIISKAEWSLRRMLEKVGR